MILPIAAPAIAESAVFCFPIVRQAIKIAGAAIGSIIGASFGYGYTAGGVMSSLTAMALFPSFGAPLWAALIGSAIASVFQLICADVFGYFGLRALSTSFCLTSICILLLLKKWNQKKVQ